MNRDLYVKKKNLKGSKIILYKKCYERNENNTRHMFLGPRTNRERVKQVHLIKKKIGEKSVHFVSCVKNSFFCRNGESRSCC